MSGEVHVSADFASLFLIFSSTHSSSETSLWKLGKKKIKKHNTKETGRKNERKLAFQEVLCTPDASQNPSLLPSDIATVISAPTFF